MHIGLYCRESTGDDGGDSPPTNQEMQLEERKQLFEYRQKLGRLPQEYTDVEVHILYTFFVQLRLAYVVFTPPEKYSSPFQPPTEDIAPASAVSNPDSDFKPGPVVCLFYKKVDYF